MGINHVKVAELSRGIVVIPQDDNSRNTVSERRRDVRHKCEGVAEFYTEGIDERTHAAVSDISRSGCYLEMQATSPVKTLVDLLITVNGIAVRVKGIVRTSYPLLGMGIAFTDITQDAQLQLEELILLCAVRTTTPAAEASGPSLPAAVPGLLMIMDAGAALNALASFFQNNQTLTREHFGLLVSKSQNHDSLNHHKVQP